MKLFNRILFSTLLLFILQLPSCAFAKDSGNLFNKNTAMLSALKNHIDDAATIPQSGVSVGNVISTEDLGVNNNSSASILDAINYAADKDITLLFEGTYSIDNCITVSKPNLKIIFNNPTFNISDKGKGGKISNGLTGKIGFLFKGCDNLSITGSARCIGAGTVGSSSLAGMVFDSCDNAKVPCEFYYENMAAGRFVLWCNNSEFGNIRAYRMKGTQTFVTGTAGTAESVVGNYRCKFGDIISFENYKPILYLSIGFGPNPITKDNELCEFGFVSGTAAPGSAESSLIAIRSAVNCTFKGGYGEGFANGLNIIKYPTDDDYKIDNVVIDAIYGNYHDTLASTNTAIQTVALGTRKIGRIFLNFVDVTCTGQYGIYCNSGELTILDAKISGGTRSIGVSNSILHFGKLEASNTNKEYILIDGNCEFKADYINITTGTTGSATAAIKVNDNKNNSKVDIKKIKYRYNNVGSNVLYVFMDLNNGFNSRNINSIDGTGASSQARFVNNEFSILSGRIKSISAPTSGTYAKDTIVLNSNPVPGGYAGWICNAAGTPGTWKGFGLIVTGQ